MSCLTCGLLLCRCCGGFNSVGWFRIVVCRYICLCEFVYLLVCCFGGCLVVVGDGVFTG